MRPSIRESPLTDQPAPDAERPLLEVDGVRKHFPAGSRHGFGRVRQQVHAVDDVSLTLMRGETLGLVGESGCGKSTLGRLIARLIEPDAGRVVFDGRDVTALHGRELRPLRREIQFVFQDPYSSLNPRQTIGTAIGTAFALQKTVPDAEIPAQVHQLMEIVGLSPEHYNRYPHEFSGGQRQRVGIARALALRPALIVCDEPVSALDVSIQAQIVNLLEDLQDEFNLSYIVIAHDLSVVRHVSDRVAVMYLGSIVEVGPAQQVYSDPRHPYTRALLSSVPSPRPGGSTAGRITLSGDVPSPLDPPTGCRFHTRCWKAQDICRVVEPELTRAFDSDPADHTAACHFPEGEPVPRATDNRTEIGKPIPKPITEPIPKPIPEPGTES
jgi:oligopeptide/dipeptide ABC transporter ATP-binding protein